MFYSSGHQPPGRVLFQIKCKFMFEITLNRIAYFSLLLYEKIRCKPNNRPGCYMAVVSEKTHAHKTYTQYGLCIIIFIYKLNSRLYRIKAFTQKMPSVLLACKPNFTFTRHGQH